MTFVTVTVTQSCDTENVIESSRTNNIIQHSIIATTSQNN